MIQLKTPEQIEIMKIAGKITGEALLIAKEMIHEGVTTKEIDEKICRYIKKNGAKPTFLGYGGFPASACISVNEMVVHGIPDERILKDGDIVSVDVGAFLNGKPYKVKINLPPLAGIFFMKEKDPVKKKAKASAKKPAAKKTPTKKAAKKAEE